ncbi:MAG: hypothetical protein H7311_13505 [Ramlibacter sp.]|nr:hypothetical protein [Cryobacterium sp.]
MCGRFAMGGTVCQLLDHLVAMVPTGSPSFGGKPVFNARIESVARLGLFRNPFLKARCIVFAIGYSSGNSRNREGSRTSSVSRGIRSRWPGSRARRSPRA